MITANSRNSTLRHVTKVGTRVLERLTTFCKTNDENKTTEMASLYSVVVLYSRWQVSGMSVSMGILLDGCKGLCGKAAFRGVLLLDLLCSAFISLFTLMGSLYIEEICRSRNRKKLIFCRTSIFIVRLLACFLPNTFKAAKPTTQSFIQRLFANTARHQASMFELLVCGHNIVKVLVSLTGNEDHQFAANLEKRCSSLAIFGDHTQQFLDWRQTLR